MLFRTLITTIIVVCLLLAVASSSAAVPTNDDNGNGGGSSSSHDEYYGVHVGSLRNASHGISGQVWLANASTLQINGFSIESPQKQELAFAFINDESVELVKSLYKVVAMANGGGEEMLIPVKKRLDNNGGGGVMGERLVALAPHGSSVTEWKRFGVVAGKSRKQLATVSLAGVAAPVPFCCIQQETGQGVAGDHYSAGTGPILVEDSRSLVLQKFSLEANKAPDAWIFAGNGEVRQSTGKKAMVIGRDTPNRHCSLRDFYAGDQDLRVRLAPGQNIYNIDYLSLFCYQYDVDFGHINFRMDPKHRVPAFIPGIGNQTAAAATSQQQQDSPEFLESNDLDGTC